MNYPTDYPALGVALFFFFLFIFILEYARGLYGQINDGRIELSKLRKRGVELRNEGRRIEDEKHWNKWEKETLDWHKEVHAAIEKINVADAEWFNIMDIVSKPRIEIEKAFTTNTLAVDNRHPIRYEEHDFQVMRLGEMIRDLWGRK